MFPSAFKDSWVVTEVYGQGSVIISNIQRSQHQPDKGYGTQEWIWLNAKGANVLPQSAFLLKCLLHLGNNALKTMTKGHKESLGGRPSQAPSHPSSKGNRNNNKKKKTE